MEIQGGAGGGRAPLVFSCIFIVFPCISIYIFLAKHISKQRQGGLTSSGGATSRFGRFRSEEHSTEGKDAADSMVAKVLNLRALRLPLTCV